MAPFLLTMYVRSDFLRTLLHTLRLYDWPSHIFGHITYEFASLQYICNYVFDYISYLVILQDGGRSNDADASIPWTRTQAGTVATEQVQIYSPTDISYMYN
jgi:hypothetical protein